MATEPTDPRVAALGQAIRRLRRERNLSQEEVAARAGVHPNHLGRIERGTKDLRVTTFFRLLEALGATPAELELPELISSPPAQGAMPHPRAAPRGNGDLLQRIDEAQRLLRDIRTTVAARSSR